MNATTLERVTPAGPPRATSGRRVAITVAGVALLVVATYVWGRWLQANGHRLFLNLPPLVGHLDPRLAPAGIAAPILGIGAVVFGPRLAARQPWGRLVAICVVGSAAWAVSLALTEGVGGILRAPAGPRDYLVDAPSIGSPAAFLGSYVEEIDRYATHVRAHPPGMTLIAWSLWRLGGGPEWLAGMEVLVGASAVAAVLLALRETSGEYRARAAAPFLTFAPVALAIASTGDALFAGVGAWAVTLVILSTGRSDRPGTLLALGGGFLFGVTAFMSYGLVLLVAIPLAVAWTRRRFRPLALAVLGALPVFLVFLAAGFWWLKGLLATRIEYLESAARLRPYGYFLVANVAAFAVIVGPAAVAGLASRVGRATWSLAGGALVAVALADLSGMSKGEAERIWIPFAVWVLAATAALPERSRPAWLAVNVTFALLLEVLVRQPW